MFREKQNKLPASFSLAPSRRWNPVNSRELQAELKQAGADIPVGSVTSEHGLNLRTGEQAAEQEGGGRCWAGGGGGGSRTNRRTSPRGSGTGGDTMREKPRSRKRRCEAMWERGFSDEEQVCIRLRNIAL